MSTRKTQLNLELGTALGKSVALCRRRRYTDNTRTGCFGGATTLASRVFKECSNLVCVVTTKVIMHSVTTRIIDGTDSPTILYVSRYNGRYVSLLSKRLKKTGGLAQRITTTVNTTPIVAATASIRRGETPSSVTERLVVHIRPLSALGPIGDIVTTKGEFS